MFGKIQNNKYVYHNPKDEVYKEAGYFPIIETPYPEVDEESPKRYKKHYEYQDDTILQTWIEDEPEITIPEEDDEMASVPDGRPTLEDRVTQLERQMMEILDRFHDRDHR